MINICTIKGTDTVSKGGENKPERGELAEYLIPNLETTQMGHISTGARRKDRGTAPENPRWVRARPDAKAIWGNAKWYIHQTVKTELEASKE